VLINLAGLGVIALSHNARAVFNLTMSLPVVYLAAFAVQFRLLSARGYRFCLPATEQMLGHWKKIALLGFPLLFSSCAESLAYMVDKSIAAWFGAGIITSLALAQSLTFFAVRILLFPLMRIVFPQFSRLYHQGDTAGMRAYYYRSLELVAIIFVPIAVFIFAHNTAIVKGIYLGANFTAQNVATVARIQMFYSFALVFNVLSMVPNFLLQAAQRNRYSGAIGVTGFAVNIACSIVFSLLFGYVGVPMGTTASFLVFTVLMFWAVRRTLGFLVSARVVVCFAAVVPLSALCVWLAGMLDPAALPLAPPARYAHLADLGLKLSFFPLCWGMCFAAYWLLDKKSTVRAAAEEG
jgi:peptidoglycan biosynthesis protein MviN/MurJ (putative lipid II flippase)